MLADLAREARYPVLLMNDSDIEVPPDYLSRLVAPLEDPDIGIVTCLYPRRGRTTGRAVRSLGIATDFAPSVLVAPLVGVGEFGLGATLAFRAETLRADRRVRGAGRLPGRRLSTRPPHHAAGHARLAGQGWS